LTGHGDIGSAVQAIRLGAFDYLTKPFEPGRLAHTVRQALDHRQLLQRTTDLQRQLAKQVACEPIVGIDPAMVALRNRIATVARSDVNVLIAGETGTGKELVAKALHAASTRAAKPFIAINCAALPESLFASELFGHERGSFTSAVQTRVGRLETAEGGSLFLDEIGDLPISVQGSLLRVLQERCFERIGSSRRVAMDVRIIAATKRNLQHEVRAGGFREDLFFRLDVVHLVCPPLRERRGDIPLLVDHFLRRHAARGGPPTRISSASMQKLLGYSWPGNVRELENVLARAALLSRNRTFEPADLDLAMDSANGNVPPLALAAMEQQHIAHVLDLCGWNRSETARALGVDRGTLHRKIAQFGLRPKPDPGIR
jgi:DNA-binding NtrC family response regulator